MAFDESWRIRCIATRMELTFHSFNWRLPGAAIFLMVYFALNLCCSRTIWSAQNLPFVDAKARFRLRASLSRSGSGAFNSESRRKIRGNILLKSPGLNAEAIVPTWRLPWLRSRAFWPCVGQSALSGGAAPSCDMAWMPRLRQRNLPDMRWKRWRGYGWNCTCGYILSGG